MYGVIDYKFITCQGWINACITNNNVVFVAYNWCYSIGCDLWNDLNFLDKTSKEGLNFNN